MNKNQLRYADYCINEVYNTSLPHSATLKMKMDYSSYDESMIVINILIEFHWLIRKGTGYQLVTDKYLIIQKHGSYSNYLHFIETEQQKNVEEQNDLMQLDRKGKLLSIENLEFQKTIREQEQRIRNLTEQLNKWSLLQKYWWAMCICFPIIGFVIGHYFT